ncbi:phosphatase PAP2 family protein [Streptomyces aidingensis]|uniref:phosphatase PAP2 family protein n=1 Tax=Streptomyces aidingensis TaxID=910347 RepID=UPI001FECA077|nr:phosphatase PAP2 family protein [Streptomyces aidingensis]
MKSPATAGATAVRTGSGAGPSPSPGPQRFLARQRLVRRPLIWFELLLIAVSYGTYSVIRNAVPEQEEAAQRHAEWIWEAEQTLGLAFERAVNHAANEVTWLIVTLNYFYATLHFLVTIAVLVWLFRSHPGRYGAARLVLFATTGVALLGYYLYPLAPPRLMTGVDFIDTGLVHDTWGSLSSESMQTVSNQYAAMPSMHVGWSVWCGITIVMLARARWLKTLGALYPVLTLFVIVATANHFWLDAVGGLICLAFGYTVATLWYGALWYRLPRRPDFPPRRGLPLPFALPPLTARSAGQERATAPGTDSGTDRAGARDHERPRDRTA